LTGSRKAASWSGCPVSETPTRRVESPQNAPAKDQNRVTTAAAVQLSAREILSARSYLDWFLKWLPQVTAPADWLSDREGQAPLLRWKLYAANDPQLTTAKPAGENAPNISGPAEELDHNSLLTLQERILWRYPFAAATVEP